MARLFDFLFGKMIDRRIASYQNDIVERHLDEVQNMYRQVRGWRHDFANHVQNMNTLLEKGDHEELKSYLEKMGVELRTVDTPGNLSRRLGITRYIQYLGRTQDDAGKHLGIVVLQV